MSAACIHCGGPGVGPGEGCPALSDGRSCEVERKRNRRAVRCPVEQRPIRLEWTTCAHDAERAVLRLNASMLLGFAAARNGMWAVRGTDAFVGREVGGLDEAKRAAEACAERLLRDALAKLTGGAT